MPIKAQEFAHNGLQRQRKNSRFYTAQQLPSAVPTTTFNVSLRLLKTSEHVFFGSFISPVSMLKCKRSYKKIFIIVAWLRNYFCGTGPTTTPCT